MGNSILYAQNAAKEGAIPEVGATAEEQIADERVQQIDSLAQDPNFITVSVCIADPTDWHQDLMGVLGHAFIRLQCPTHNLDYCFSYEAESAEGEMERFLRGELRMGMFAEPTQEYIKPYQRWNRTIKEYTINMPPKAKQDLWRIMDEKVAEGGDLQFDLLRRGCTQTLVQFVEEALESNIEYAEWQEEYSMTRRQIQNRYMEPYPWIRFLFLEMMMSDAANEDVPNEDKIMIPTQLEQAWSKAKIDGQPAITYAGELTKGVQSEVTAPLVTPMTVALIVLLITIVFALLRKPYFGWVMLVAQFLIGLLLCWLAAVSSLPGTRGIHLLPLYNPLPLMLWRWRRYWALPYAAILGAWIIYGLLATDIYIEPAHFVFALAMMVFQSQDFLAAKITRRK